MYYYIIVDDEELICEGIRIQLSPLNDVLTCIGEARNGEEAISLLEQTTPDIIVLDMQMPIMDGTQLLPYLSEHYKDLQIIVISGYKDFDYMKHAISANAVDYVLKPFSRQQIQDTLRKAISRLENTAHMNHQLLESTEQKENAYYENDIQMLKTLILGYPTDNTAISSRQLMFINSSHNLYLFLLNADQPLLLDNFRAYFRDAGYEDLALFLPHLNNLHLGFLILFVPEHSVLKSHKLCEQVMEELSMFLSNQGIHCYYGISRDHTDLRQLNIAYNEACMALNSRIITETTDFYSFYSGELEAQPISWEKTDEFLFRLESGMTDQVQQLSEEFYAHELSIPGLTLNDMKFQYYSLTNQCLAIMDSYSKQYRPSMSMQNIIKSIFDPMELKNYYHNFFQNLCEILKDNNVYATDDTIEKIKIYIQRNYNKNLTIDLIASFFYINASYFSHIFKQRTGEKFVDYLNRIRIEKSKQLLTTTDRKMYQIAKTVGYDNVKYFFRIFKKKEGMTPEQFRKKGE